MKINMNEIFDFFEMRIKCHVDSVNYFAGLLGYSFPEHDQEKVIEPMRTGYAYVFYRTYHKNFRLLSQQVELCEDAIMLHHNHSSHHIEYYEHVKDIPDVRLYEILSDWASANFEQRDIRQELCAVSLLEWWEKNMANLEWTEHQREIIKNVFEVFESETDKNKLLDIWGILLENSDL